MVMQLNIYVPKEKTRVLEALDEATRRTGRPKSELVLEALEGYLRQVRPQFGVFHLGRIDLGHRDDLYLERWG